MTTTMEMARKRLEIAEDVAADFRGKRQDGLTLIRIAEYTIVDDGQDRWLTLTGDLEDGTDEIVGDILDGKYDRFKDDPAELLVVTYSDLCSVTSCIYSRNGSPSAIADVADLEAEDYILAEIVEVLGLDNEYAEHVADND
jgi:hypothetical protein